MSEREARRDGYPLTIPDRLLLSEAMRRACAVRDFGEVFRLVNRRAGASYADIASAVGKMTSARVGDVIRGSRRIRGTAVIERIADGLGIPGDMLGIPERPWERPAAALTATTTSPAADPHSPDMAAMDSFRMADRQLGGGHLYPSVVHYLHTRVAPRLFGSDSNQRPEEAFQAAAALTEMAGWMAHDSGHDDRAHQHFTQALSLAQVGADPTLHANILASMSHLAFQRGQLDEAVSLARAGQVRSHKGPKTPALSSRLHAMEARALAQRGEPDATQRALAAAHEELAKTGDTAPLRWTSPFDAAALASEVALCLRDLGNLPAAAVEAERAVSLRSADRPRGRVFGQIALAQVWTQREELEAACAVGYDLLNVCRTLSSMRITQQLGALAQALSPYRTARPVADLLDCLAAVNQQRALVLAGINAPHAAGGAAT